MNSEIEIAQQKPHWTFWLGVMFFVVVIITIFSLSILLNKRLTAQEASPITSIEIVGEMPYTTRSDIEQVISQVNLGNFFNVDVNQVQQKIHQLSWVYSVAIRKIWPNELKIYVTDQKPVAYWNRNFLINEYGEAFQADSKRIKHFIPDFFGPEGSEHLALSNFKNFQALLHFNQLSIEEIVLSERFSWQLTLNDGVTIRLGKNKGIERIQRFMDSYQQIKLQGKSDQQVNYVDLRYDTGMAVGWISQVKKERV